MSGKTAQDLKVVFAREIKCADIQQPCSLAFDRTGQLFVHGQKRRVLVFARDRTFVTSISEVDDFHFDYLAVASDGRVFVLDHSKNVVRVFAFE